MSKVSRKVLIVEDEVLVGMMLARKIEERGFSVCEVVGTGEEAVSATDHHAPGVILMDVSLGGEMDGIEAGQRIRETSSVPIIFFTGYYQDKNLLARAKEIQPLAVMDKLETMDKIVTVLERAFPAL